jgi:hypothetical protein
VGPIAHVAEAAGDGKEGRRLAGRLGTGGSDAKLGTSSTASWDQ